MLGSENVRDDDVVEKAGDRVLRVGKARGSVAGRDGTARGSHGGMRGVGGHVEGVACVSLWSRLPRRRYDFRVAGTFSRRRQKESD